MYPVLVKSYVSNINPDTVIRAVITNAMCVTISYKNTVLSRCARSRNANRQSCLYIVPFLILLLLPLPVSASGSSKSRTISDSVSCISCHVMQAEYDAWRHSSHRRTMCVDCHLPNENKASHYLWKAIDGLKDFLAYHSGMVPEKITISSHGEKVVQANCLRCHETAVMVISRERKCWDCHKRISHQHTGLRTTL